MSGSIFISYRRGADSNAAGRLNDRLEASFRRENLFFDVDAIAPGVDFVDLLQEKVDACDILLVVIGHGWLNARDEDGNPRLDNPEDFVRIEVARGLSARKHVIPILVDGAAMPKASTLPDDMKALARRNAAPLNHETFKADFDKLVRSLTRTLETIEAEREKQMLAREADMERLRIERERAELAEKRRKEEAEAARLRAEKDAADRAAREKAEREKQKRLAGEEAERRRIADETAAVRASGPHDEQNRDGAEPKPTGEDNAAVDRSAVDVQLRHWVEDRWREEKTEVKTTAEPDDAAKNDQANAAGRPSRRFLLLGGGALAAGALSSPLWLPAVVGRAIKVEPDHVLRGHSQAVMDIDFHLAGGVAATASADKTAIVWDTNTGEALVTADAHTDAVMRTIFAPETKVRLLTTSDDYTARIWSGFGRGDDGRVVFSKSIELTGHTAFVKGAAWSPDGSNVVTGGGSAARLWDSSYGLLVRAYEGLPDPIGRVLFSSDRRYIAAAGKGPVCVWRVISGERVALLEGPTDIIDTLGFSPNASAVLAASWDNNAYVWPSFSDKPAPDRLPHDDWVMSAHYSPDGSRILTGSFDGTAVVWDAGRKTRLLTMNVSGSRCYGAVFGPEGRLALTSSDDGLVQIWDSWTGTEQARLTGGTGAATNAIFSPEGRRVMAGFDDGTACLWTLPDAVLSLPA